METKLQLCNQLGCRHFDNCPTYEKHQKAIDKWLEEFDSWLERFRIKSDGGECQDLLDILNDLPQLEIVETFPDGTSGYMSYYVDLHSQIGIAWDNESGHIYLIPLKHDEETEWPLSDFSIENMLATLNDEWE